MWRGKQQEVEYKHFFPKSCLISVQMDFLKTSVFTQADGMPLCFLLRNCKEKSTFALANGKRLKKKKKKGQSVSFRLYKIIDQAAKNAAW